MKSKEDELREKLLIAESRIVSLKHELRKARERNGELVRGKNRGRNSDNRRYVYAVFGGICFHCNKKVEFSEFKIDHLWPRCQGGKNEKINLVCSCERCNQKKGNNLPGLLKIKKCIEMHQAYEKIKVKSKEEYVGRPNGGRDGSGLFF